MYLFKAFLLLSVYFGYINCGAQSLRETTLASTKRAQEMVAVNNWEEASEHLKSAISKLGTDPANAAYRSYLHFYQGYLYEQQSEEKLGQALRSYQLALKENPKNTKALNNAILIYKKQGNHEAALSNINLIKRMDTLKASQWDLLTGDIYIDSGRLEEAWSGYKKAQAANPDNRSIALKMITIYDQLPQKNHGKLIDQCKTFLAQGNVEMARLGFEEILKLHCNIESRYFEAALLGWAGVISANGWVQPRLIKDIGQMNCEAEPLVILKKNITETWQRNTNTSWWGENDKRRFYYLALQKSWANYLLSKGKKREAMMLFIATRNSLRRIKDLSKEIYGREDVLETESLVQLARLYADRDLNPEGAAFDRLEAELFNQKGRAYRTRDLPGIQKFHTVLALIYVERKQWNGGEYARNAIFQLEHAISTAERRVKGDPSLYKPLPHLYRYLAQGYLTIDKLNEATDASLNAAISYLETDNLELSKKMIWQADSLKPRDTTSQDLVNKQIDVKALYQARVEVANLDASSFVTSDQKYYRHSLVYKWLDLPKQMKSIDPKILDRQKFKIISDLSIQAKKVGATQVSGNLKKEAIKNADHVRVLSSQQDVIRLKQIDVAGNLTNYANEPGNNRQIKKNLKNKNQYLLPGQSDQMKRVIIRNQEIEQ